MLIPPVLHHWGFCLNFYQHHIGDFNNATRHLSRVERSVYRDLLEIYYDTEKPLIVDVGKLARRALCVAQDERDALELVLAEFFEMADDGYHNARADRELEAYRRMAEGGKRGAATRWGAAENAHPMPTPCPPQSEANANHEPITMNHKPHKVKSIVATPLLADIDPQIAEDWQKLRKAKKAPITATAVDGIRAQALKAGLSLGEALAICCRRGWASFDASWDWRSTGPPRESAKHAEQRRIMDSIKGGNGSDRDAIDGTAERIA